MIGGARMALQPQQGIRVPDLASGPVTVYPDDRSIAEIFSEIATAAPGAVAVSDHGRRLSYSELDEWSNRLALRLADSGVRPGEPVALVGGRCLEAVVGMVAIVKVGAAYVPLDRGDPVARLRALADVLAVRRLVTVPGAEGLLDRIPAFSVTDIRDGPAVSWRPVSVGGDACAYVMFTSGSTGVPKAVAIPHRAIARLVINTDYIDITAEDRISHTGHLAFDASVFELWGALLNGGRSVIVDPETLVDPVRLEKLIRDAGVTISWLSAGVFHHCARLRPGMFRGLRYLISGGDVLSPPLVRKVLSEGPPQNLLNGYGPTENTTFSTTYRIETVPPSMTRIPIGRPIANSTCMITTPDGSVAPTGVEGELWVGGDGVALGYVNSAELTQRRFVPDPGGRRAGARMFRTGDVAVRLPDGNLDFLGRRDRMVKFRDFRIELDEIEAVLDSCPNVAGAGVVAVASGEHTDAIVGFYVPAPGNGTGNGSGQSEAVRRFLAERLPHFMLPSRLVPVDALPLTGSGKVDRLALSRVARSGATPAPVPKPRRPPTTPTQVGLARLWAEFLDADVIDLDDDFFALGGNSLIAARVFARLQALFGIDVTQGRFLTSRLLADPSLEACAAAVDEARAGDGAGPTVGFEREGRLDVPVTAPRREGGRGRGGRWTGTDILLTGATGFLGSHLLRAVLTASQARVHCLVRAIDEDQAMLRLTAEHTRYELGHLPEDRVRPVVGDLGRPLLGLASEDFDRYAASMDLVIHSGAYVNFTYPYSTLAPVTVGGVKELIRLSGRHRAIPLHVVSTLAILAGYGAAGVPTVSESTALAYPEFLHMGYTETKWVAEALLNRAAAAGLPVAVYRPYEIAGDRRHGAWNLENATCAMFRVIVDTGVAPAIDLPLDLVPVDVVAAQIAHIALNRPDVSRTYHLTNPRPAMLDDMVEVLRAAGYGIRRLPFDDWVHLVTGYAAQHPQHPFTPFVPLWTDRSSRSGLAVKEMYFASHFPRFTRDHAAEALADLDLATPPVDAGLLARYVTFFQQVGFFPPPERAARSRVPEPRLRP
jgi:amino acid adenylation domain-containing protein/thioester reductase-like protein